MGDSSTGPPYGEMQVEYHVTPSTLRAVRRAYNERVEQGYDGSFTMFLRNTTLTACEHIRVDSLEVSEVAGGENL